MDGLEAHKLPDWLFSVESLAMMHFLHVVTHDSPGPDTVKEGSSTLTVPEHRMALQAVAVDV